MDKLRENCPMRHENGNCTAIGGFCTAVNDLICEGLHNAYQSGSFDSMYWKEDTDLGEALSYRLIALPLLLREELNNSAPLTIEELRQMDGEPVYIVENTEYWAIVDGFNRNVVSLISHGNPDGYAFCSLYRKTWLAYRHKPKGKI